MNSKVIHIKGMHCVACEKVLEDELSQVPFVKKAEADRKKGQVRIYWNNLEPNSLALEKIIRKVGYGTFEKNELKITKNKINWREWAKAFLVVGVLFLFFKFFQSSGILDGIDLGSHGITYGISFIIGLVASVSSCLAVVGAVVIAFSEKYKNEGSTFFERSAKPNFLFHLGRLVTFFVLGGTLGIIGGEINVSGNFISIFTIIIALIMGWLGLNILGLIPSISNLGIIIPKSLSKHWSTLKESNHRAAPFLLGGLTFFLPCGFTQSMQIFALASGSFLTGGITLFLFALGTVPALLALGVTATWTKAKGIDMFRKVAGLLIIFFAVYTLNSGLALRGVKNNVLNSDIKQEEKATASAAKQEQIVEMHITSRGFEPNILKVKKGIPVRWIIKGDQVTSCTNKIIIPSLNITKSISFGENIVTFTPTKSGDISFSCWMGMVRGKFVVE